LQEIIYIVLILLLIKIAFIDYKQKIIPDVLNLIIALLGIFNLILNFENCKIYIASAAITFAVLRVNLTN
jgi:prepilin signal peptidase PulO-like enzyme (type II secretory pathway)